MHTKTTTTILRSLRALMRDTKTVKRHLDAYIVPSGDSHQNEYISACDCRREYISGFAGSAGTAVVTATEAAIWVDGRYHLQAEAQTDDNWTVMKEGLQDTKTIPQWLAMVLKTPESAVGVDPNILSASTWEQLDSDLEAAGHTLVPVAPNLIDKIWENRPGQPCNSLMTLDISFTGACWTEKIALLRQKMETVEVTSCVITALDDIAWLLNLRGSDIPYNPVFYSYVIVTADKICLFIDESRITPEVRNHLSVNGSPVDLLPYYDMDESLSHLVQNNSGKIWLSKGSSQKIHNIVPKAQRYVTDTSHVTVMKAVKNITELAGMRNAHYKDAVTLCEFFSWLEAEVPHKEITESQAADKLELIKRGQTDYIGLSFDTISSTGSNAAVIHYKPTPGEDKVIDSKAIYLCDSGAQYKDGTTDVTRTIHFGDPSEYERECYTRVLKGHIALASAVWPCGVKGHMLDTLARMHLWSAGLDYKHGTGHGVGAFLNVHEGPCSISFKTRAGEVPLESGMVVTDEPGYYEDGKFGVRIENCMLVTEAGTKYNFKDVGFLKLEPITLVPISTKLIEPTLMTEQEIDWLNSYHSRCRDLIAPLLRVEGKGKALEWLIRETEPIG